MYDVTTGLNVDFVFYSLDLPKYYYPSTILEPEYGPWAFCLFCIITAMYGVHSILFFVPCLQVAILLLFLLIFVFSSQGKWYVEDPTGAVQVDLTDAVSFVLLKDIVL